MSRASVIIGVMIFACCLPILAGCGGKLPLTATTTGRITYNGKPVIAGQVMFQPQQGRPAIGIIDENGNYLLTTFVKGDGATLGHHRVTINASHNVGGSKPKSVLDERTAPSHEPRMEWLVPEKYSRLESSPLTAEIKPGNNTINFNL